MELKEENMLGNTLKLIRISNNMSYSFVSKELNLKISLIKDIEADKTKLSLNTLNMFSDFYQIPVSKILLLNDFQERFLISEDRMIEDIKTYYEIKREQDNIITKVKVR